MTEDPMSAARTAEQGLSTQDVEAIRETLAAGRKPKVQFTSAAGQIAGQVGQVVELTDPKAGDDYLVVRFGRDELPFSPADLTIPARAPRKAAKAVTEKVPDKPAVPPPPPEPEFKLDKPIPAPREEKKTMPTSASTVDSTAASAAPAESGGPAGSGGPTRPAKKAARPAKPKGPSGLTVTVTYADGEWTVAAQQGSKALAKPYLIKPGEALKMVSLLDVPGVQEAVEQILAAERAEAQQAADRLRAELAEIEAKLAELGE
jgi:hypothetical protein